MKQKLWRFFRTNYIIWCYWAVMLSIELTGVCVTSGKFYIRNPLMFFSLIGIFTAVLFSIKNQKGRYWCAFVLALVLFVVDLVFIVIFDMTGTTFDFAMLQLRGDAMTIVEKLQVDFVFVLVSGLIISAYMVLAHYYLERAPKPERIMPRGAIAAVMAAVLVFHGGMAYFDNRNYDPSDLSYLLYTGDEGTYTDRGILGNFVDELYKGAFFNRVQLGDPADVENEIYKTVNEPTKSKLIFNPADGEKEVFGAAKDFNVITILAESFEWYGFMAEAPYAVENAFPKGFNYSFAEESAPEKTDSAKISQILQDLYPNLYKLYNTSVVGLNHHSREKTDVSENHSIIGNYPTGSLINYDYNENTIPYSVPNVLGTLDEDIISRSYHNGNYTFYNRGEFHKNVLGFEKFTAIEQMIELDKEKNDGAVFEGKGADAWSKNEHNLDSDMIEVCKEEMFPADRRFNTYITTIAMHGQYDYRDNLVPYYKKLIEAGIADVYIKDSYVEPDFDKISKGEELSDEEKAEIIMKAKIAALKKDSPDPFIHYAAAAIDTDRAIGKLMDYLENTVSEVTGEPLINNTLIVMFGDHNAYYQGLGETVKDLSEYNPERNYTDLFRVPLMVHVGNQTLQIPINKFTCTVDIVPTIFDLLGINYYNNLNYGSSIFGENVSMLYSRSYNNFITDKLFFTSINNIRYKTPDATQADVDKAEKDALALLEKTSYVNKIFYHDFLSGSRAQTYYQKLKELNAK